MPFRTVGNESRINTTQTGDQAGSSVARLTNGDIIVVWTDASQLANLSVQTQIRGQRLAQDGSRIGTEFVVNATSAGAQSNPSVTALSNGGFAVSWTNSSTFTVKSYPGGNSAYLRPPFPHVVSRKFAADGDPLPAPHGDELVHWADEFGIIDPAGTTEGEHFQGESVIISNPGAAQEQYLVLLNSHYYASRSSLFDHDWRQWDGILWSDSLQFTAPDWIRLDIAFVGGGGPALSRNRPAGFGTHEFADPDAVVLNDRKIVIAYDFGPEGSTDTRVIVERWFVDNTTDPTLPTLTSLNQRTTLGVAATGDFDPATAALAGGGYVVTWTQFGGSVDTSRSIRAQMFNPNGSLNGANFLVNTATGGHQQFSDVAGLVDGRFVVVWQDESHTGGDTSGSAIRGQVYSSDGLKSGSPFLVNTATAGNQMAPTVTALANGNFIVTWTDANGDSSGSAIKSQRFNPSIFDGADGDNIVYGGSRADEFHGGDGADRLFGRDGNDKLFGDDDVDILEGHKGRDELDGGNGSDTMRGGPDNDTYYVNSNGDRVIEQANEGTDLVRSLVALYTLPSHVENLALWGFINSNGTGNNQANTITGNGFNNVLNGAGGADTMNGGAGDDTYHVNNANDVVNDSIGNDTIVATVSYTLGAAAKVDLLRTSNAAGTTLIDFTGNNSINRLEGNAANNALNGRIAADTMQGFAGNDTYRVDNGGDVVIEAAGGGSDTVIASATFKLGAGSEVELMKTADAAATTVINLTGNELANTLQGNAGANRLNGGGGIDITSGFGGDDTYRVDNLSDQINETAGQGLDRVIATATYILANAADIEELTTTGPNSVYAANFVGNGLANAIEGNAAGNQLNGADGNDTLTGHGGADLFRFTNALGASNVDTVTDFVVADDTFQLFSSIFTGLTAGTLAAGAFRIGAAAAGADDRIIYNATTGALSFDADGNGGGAAIQFAILSAGLTLTNADFLVS